MDAEFGIDASDGKKAPYVARDSFSGPKLDYVFKTCGAYVICLVAALPTILSVSARHCAACLIRMGCVVQRRAWNWILFGRQAGCEVQKHQGQTNAAHAWCDEA
eukprot:COSAG01_NODE_917_length_12755_cov_11.197851_11_plen_104_part_00